MRALLALRPRPAGGHQMDRAKAMHWCGFTMLLCNGTIRKSVASLCEQQLYSIRANDVRGQSYSCGSSVHPSCVVSLNERTELARGLVTCW